MSYPASPFRFTLLRSAAALLLPLLLSLPAAAQTDWEAVEREAVGLLERYIAIDTTNPPGNEAAAARFWQDVLAAEGIAAQVFEPQPGRGVVYARLKGSGEKKPLILLHHMDVVSARAENWRTEPFTATLRDGHLHGRGAIDCKGVAVVQFLALALLKRQGAVPERDVIFLGTGDEETGGRLGAGWFVEHHSELIRDAGFLLTEGGGIRRGEDGTAYTVSVAEKAPCWIKLTAEGKPGHGSTPRPGNAVARLLRALDNVRQYATPLEVVPAAQAYFTALAEHEDDAAQADRYRHLERALADPDFRRTFTADPRHNALVRNTIAPTVLRGSDKTNVIPGRAEAELDCRLLPGEDPERFVATLTEVVDDPQVEVSVLLNFPAAASEADTPLFRAIAAVAARRDPEARVLPSMLTGFTDAHYFRKQGIVSYGFSGIALRAGESYGVHGHDERVPLAGLREGVQVLVEVIRELDAR